MDIRVNRQACCSADDQVGPLEAEYQVEGEATFASVIDQIVKSRFLQYSSTHNRMTGELNGKTVVEVFSPYGASKQPVFEVNPNLLAVEVLGGQTLSFYFRHI